MTTIEITIGSIVVFRETHTRRLTDKEVGQIAREGLVGIDKSKAAITTKHEQS